MFDFSKLDVPLSKGSHASPEDGLCLMEMVAWFEGEPHSDLPVCACPVLTAFGQVLNDRMPDDLRQSLLRPLVPRLVGTRSPEHRTKRAEILAWFAIREAAPMALRAHGLDEWAPKLEAAETLEEGRDIARAAAAAAYAAAAAAAAAYAAAAADAAAYAAAYAAADAAADAYAAADAAAGADAWRVIGPKAVAAFIRAIEAGPQGEFRPDSGERYAALKELVAA